MRNLLYIVIGGGFVIFILYMLCQNNTKDKFNTPTKNIKLMPEEVSIDSLMKLADTLSFRMEQKQMISQNKIDSLTKVCDKPHKRHIKDTIIYKYKFVDSNIYIHNKIYINDTIRNHVE